MTNFQHLGRIEKGDIDMRTSTLLKILRALNLKLEDLIKL
jgi:predicted transcriptional regulator